MRLMEDVLLIMIVTIIDSYIRLKLSYEGNTIELFCNLLMKLSHCPSETKVTGHPSPQSNVQSVNATCST